MATWVEVKNEEGLYYHINTDAIVCVREPLDGKIWIILSNGGEMLVERIMTLHSWEVGVQFGPPEEDEDGDL